MYIEGDDNTFAFDLTSESAIITVSTSNLCLQLCAATQLAWRRHYLILSSLIPYAYAPET